MRTKEEQEAINKACKYHPETKEELQELVDDPKVYLGEIDTSKITDMYDLFFCSKREDFSGIEKWDVANVTDMYGMFDGCKNFNQDISAWDVSKVKNMSFMFEDCEKFNQPLNDWNVREDCDIHRMFTNTSQTYENVKEVFTEKQLLDSCSEKIIEALNNKKEQIEVQKVTVKQGRGR